MVYALLGGDGRSVRLARQLRADGGEVRTFALEQALPDGAVSAAAALQGAACAVLPLPCEKDGALNAPYSDTVHQFEALLATAPPGLPVCAGKAGTALAAVCAARGLRLRDYFLREEFTLKNAELTAEGALGLLLAGPGALRGSRVLLCGFGRIGRLLAAKLLPLGAHVTAAARDPAQRALAEIMGCRAVSLERPAGEFEFIVNTVPAPVLGRSALLALPGASLIELASPPYGIDTAAAAALGRPVTLASGLPGKTAPEAAAAAVKESIYRIMEECK